MLKLERLGSLTSELSTNLMRAIVLPGGLLNRSGRRGPVRTETTESPESRPPDPAQGGTLIWTGSEELPDEAVVAALHRSGGRKGRVVALAVGPEAEPLASAAVRRFARYGVAEAEVVPVLTREAAENPVLARHLEQTQILLVCARNALEGRDLLQEATLHRAAFGLLARGGVVVGVREGGALLAGQFLTAGRPESGGEPAQLEVGLGLLPGVILPATSELQSRGPGWLLGALGPRLGSTFLGLTIESRAAVLFEQQEARVLGDGAVSFLDGSDVTPTPLESFSNPAGIPVTADAPPVLGLKVHVLLAGYGLNLRTRRPLGPAPAPAQAVGD